MVHIGENVTLSWISEADWSAIQETLYLTSIQGMRESLIEGLNTPIEEMDEDPGW